MVSFLAMDAHRHLQRSPLHPPSFGIYLVFSVLNKEDETTKLRDSFLAACAATLGGAAFLLGVRDVRTVLIQHGFAAWPDLYGLGSSAPISVS
ncbi:BnaAnng02270D [Brassica napus]|uniref:BnaAnng02270D protein n=1 Tax=Brassica napus TaxID=3708 RepID=A0A078FGF7_BRANA|nr:BnaAnng02270D [Brassica napus]